MLNPFGKLPRFAAAALIASSNAFPQNPSINSSPIEEWIQAVATPAHATDTRIAIGGNEWIFIEIRQINDRDRIFALRGKESDIAQLSKTPLPQADLPDNTIKKFVESLKKIQTTLVPEFKYSNDLTEVYFSSRSMMGSILTYRGYIRDLPKLRAIILELFPKTELPTSLQPDK